VTPSRERSPTVLDARRSGSLRAGTTPRRGYAPPPSRYSPAVQTASSASTGTRLSPEPPTPVTPRNVESVARDAFGSSTAISVAAVFDVLDVALCEAVAEPRARSALDERGEGRVRRGRRADPQATREAERTRGLRGVALVPDGTRVDRDKAGGERSFRRLVDTLPAVEARAGTTGGSMDDDSPSRYVKGNDDQRIVAARARSVVVFAPLCARIRYRRRIGSRTRRPTGSAACTSTRGRSRTPGSGLSSSGVLCPPRRSRR